ncbi:hypothetical protein CR513_23529, partial [Mucuna pruriens]
MVNEIGAVDNLRLENQLTELTSLVRQLAIGQHQPSITTIVCGICTSVEHPTHMCPTLQETELDHPESIGAVGGYHYGKQPYQRPSQGPYAAQQFGSIQNAPQGPTGYRQPISGTTVPTTTTENASSRKFTISRGPDEATSN